MNPSKIGPYIIRDQVMNLLSDQEIASVSTVEAQSQLGRGDAYLDLEHLELGVRRQGQEQITPMAHVLAKKAVRAETWSAIQVLLAAQRPGAPEPSRLG